MEDILERLYDMTAFSNIAEDPRFLIMYAIAFVLLYLGIKKQYEPLLLVPIAFGVLLANFPGGDMGVIQADENGMVMVNGEEHLGNAAARNSARPWLDELHLLYAYQDWILTSYHLYGCRCTDRLRSDA